MPPQCYLSHFVQKSEKENKKAAVASAKTRAAWDSVPGTGEEVAEVGSCTKKRGQAGGIVVEHDRSLGKHVGFRLRPRESDALTACGHLLDLDRPLRRSPRRVLS
jgi:hypothetical protein